MDGAGQSRPRPGKRCLFFVVALGRFLQSDALLFRAHTHFLRVLCFVFCLRFGIGLRKPQLLAVLIAFLHTHELLAVDFAVAKFCVVWSVRPVLVAVLDLVAFRCARPISITHAIAIEVALPPLDLGSILRLVLRTTLLSSLGYGRKRCQC